MPEQKQGGADTSTKAESILVSNMLAAINISDIVRTSLGPRGMDKMITGTSKETTITNDGATILSELQVVHPCAKMFVEMSHAQDVEVGDGTTSVVVIAGALLHAAHRLVQKGIHPNVISRSFGLAVRQIENILKGISISLDLGKTGATPAQTRDVLIQNCVTCLSSKMVSVNSPLLSELAVDAVLQVMEEVPSTKTTAVATSSATSHADVQYNADLSRIKIIKQLGAPVEASRLVVGLALPYKVCHTSVKKESSGKSVVSPSRMENAKIAVLQFCISPPKPNMDSSVTVTDASQIADAVREERKHIVGIVKALKNAGVNVVLVQKSILNEAVCDLAQHYLALTNILTVKDIERDDIQFICDALHCTPIASPAGLAVKEADIKAGKATDPFGYCDLVESVKSPSAGTVMSQTGPIGSTGPSFVQFSGVKAKEGAPSAPVVNFVCCAPNALMLEETERSIHDALCVARSLVKKPYLIPGGGAAETELAVQLGKYARSLTDISTEQDENAGLNSVGVKAFAEALETVPLTLAENAGLNPIDMLTELRAVHAAAAEDPATPETEEQKTARRDGRFFGLNIRKNAIGNMVKAKVVQPMMVTLSAVSLATETVRQILRIDDIVAAR